VAAIRGGKSGAHQREHRRAQAVAAIDAQQAG
jgi:hypothetical protein